VAEPIEYESIDHVQLAIPAGTEDEARRFYADVLGLREVQKPPALASRGGCWFESAGGEVHVHLGIDRDFRPARKAHPAFTVREADALRQRLLDVGAEVIEDHMIETRRFYTADPFGNRIEVVEVSHGGDREPRG
jgi:catechol 2,3-dioxygenase-like lactoylglutathione lyase family enzyme